MPYSFDRRVQANNQWPNLDDIAPKLAGKPVLRVSDAARVLGMPAGTLYRQIQRGQIPAIRFSGSVRLTRSTVEQLLWQRQLPPHRA
jgi:excisionase family DNA binding protein